MNDTGETDQAAEALGNVDLSNESQVPKECWACAKELRLNQIKCTECESWQNWRRHLNFSNTALALLVALAALLPNILSSIETARKTIFPNYSLNAASKIERNNLGENEYGVSVEITAFNRSSTDLFLPPSLICEMVKEPTDSGQPNRHVGGLEIFLASTPRLQVGESAEILYTANLVTELIIDKVDIRCSSLNSASGLPYAFILETSMPRAGRELSGRFEVINLGDEERLKLLGYLLEPSEHTDNHSDQKD